MKSFLSHAFAVEPESGLSDEDVALLERLAEWITKRKLGTPAVLFLQACEPLNFVGSQFLTFLRPFAQMVFDPAEYRRFVTALERRDAIPLLVSLIEKRMGVGK